MDPMTRRKAMMMLAASSGGGTGILPVEWENSKLKFDETQAQAIKSGQMFSCTVDGVVLIAYVSKFPYSASYQSAGEVLLAYGGNLYRGCLVFDSETTAYFNAAPNGASPANPSSLVVITLPDVTAADNGKVLGVENGAWGKMDAPSGLPDISQSPDVTFFLSGTNGEWVASIYYANTMWYDYTAAAAQIISGAIQVAAATGSEVAWYIPLDSTQQAGVAEFFATLRDITNQSACYISVSNYVAPMAFHMNGDTSEPDKMQIEARFTIPQNGTLFKLHFLLTLTTAYVTCTPVTPTLPPRSDYVEIKRNHE